MSRQKTDMKKVFAYIPARQLNRINEEAQKCGITFSEAFRRILDKQLEEDQRHR